MTSTLYAAWVLLFLAYVALMLFYKRGWQLQKIYSIPEGFVPTTKIAVIIPARNEAKNIEACVRSILNNQYPQTLLEIIVIDDHSTDNTYDIVTGLHHPSVRCLRLQDFAHEETITVAYKKKAIEIGVRHAEAALIVTTDADCIAPPKWLWSLSAIYIEQQPVFIIGAVTYHTSHSLLSVFQSLDFMTMQGITVATHQLRMGNMCNGANLAFSKEAFYAVNGYQGADHMASGDDFLLLVKMQQAYPNNIAYLKSKEAIMATAPQESWRSFLNQRIRWASKSGNYNDHKMTAMLMVVYLFNLSFLFLLIGCFFDNNCLKWLLGGLLGKTIVELFFLFPVAGYYEKKKELWLFPLLQPLHIAYIIVAGFLGMRGTYQWKGRQVK